ncbi:MAG: MoaD/ThiS family protein [Candidatus Tectomicrobia bacterium]|uniref:MoaD/ThiS family protein n=1 Tax=Tectimicrobiota bacterium TaxID=2528274 RepID=A0A933GJ28_UNCTE|nr:MoaD/ThiS family protein [Candidatus Tectomicrobia bacterium]
MKVEVRLFATLQKHAPQGCQPRGFELELNGEATAGEVLDRLSISRQLPLILLVNGIHSEQKGAIKEGDVVSIFPPVAGG